MGWDTTEVAHKPTLSYKAVGGTNYIIRPWIKHGGGNFKVDKGGMVHQNKARLFFVQPVHTDFFKLKPYRNQIGQRTNLKHGAKKDIRPFWFNSLFGFYSHNLVIAFCRGFNFHNFTSVIILPIYSIINANRIFCQFKAKGRINYPPLKTYSNLKLILTQMRRYKADNTGLLRR